jgi:glycosyltransferase involved in cell wall biosynthesis
VTPDVVRVLPELRISHIEDAPALAPATVYYLRENYDVVGVPVPDGFHRIGLPALLAALVRSRARVLEAPEPLWMRFLPRWLALVVVWRLGGVLRGVRRRTVVYAMEHNDIAVLIGGPRGVPRVVEWAFRIGLGLCVRLLVDRICFATEPSRDAYLRLSGVHRVEHAVVLELQAARPQASGRVPRRGRVAFVGVLEERKGLRYLVRAWERVERAFPSAELVLGGVGALEEELRAWAAARPEQRRVVGRLGHDAVHELMITSDVVVVPSIPWGRSREQVCLPVLEGLSNGCTVVVTDQTGIAGWLREHGHHVVDLHDLGDRFVVGLADALTRAVRAPLDRSAVLDSLPDPSGVVRSNRYLHG